MVQLIFISGPPGVGKSSLSRRIAGEEKALVLLDKDLIDEAFSPGDRGENYTKYIEPKVIEALFNIAKENLGLNKSVLIDLPLTHILIQSPYLKKEIEDIVNTYQLDLKVIELYLEESHLYQRIKDRGLERDQEKLSEQGWEEFKKRDSIEKRISLESLELDASKNIEELLKEALSYIRGQ